MRGTPKEDTGTPAAFSSSLYSPAMIGLACFYHDIILQPKATQSWAEASKTESISKLFPFVS